MQNADYSSSPYYNAYPNPNPNPPPIEPNTHAPTSYASAPPYSSTPYTAPPPPPSPTTGNYAPPNYPSIPHNTDHVLAAPSSYAQPQSPYSFPQFESHSTHPPQSQTQSQPSYYPTYDQQVNYAPNPNPSPRPPESSYVPHQQQFQLNSAGYDANYDAYDPNMARGRSDLGSQLYGKRDQTGYNTSSYGSEGLYGDNRNLSRATSDLGSEFYGKRDQSGYSYASNYGSESPYGDSKILSRGRSDLGSELYGKRDQSGYSYNSNYGSEKSGLGDNDGVYAYKGSSEPYGARGTAPKSSTWSGFDDFGRPIGYSASSSAKEGSSLGSGLKVVRAVPKAETTQDAKGGVQKFRVKLLAESAGQETMDVLCQIALDGIRMLDPSTSRTLRIYLLDTITRCEAIDSSIFAFWSKTPVDIEARRIRLKSNSYTTNTLLDTVTAAIAQYKEMSARSRPQEYPKVAEQSEKKKGFADFITLIKQVNEEKDHWVPDEAISKCTSCGTDFSAFVRKHHCRNCGDIFCDKCTQGRTALTAEDKAPVVRVCDRCLGEVTRRLNTAKVAANRPSVVESHEDLAKKLQEELEKSCKISSGSKSNSSGKRMKEVACPTCTVHLQVQVPSFGSETIECGVCQHPFLVTGY